MRIKDLIEQLSTYEENSEVIIYDDDNDREYEIAAIDEDEGGQRFLQLRKTVPEDRPPACESQAPQGRFPAPDCRKTCTEV